MAEPSLQQLRCFVAVAEELGFTRAAERLGLAASTVSEQVSGLERRLGTVLVTRTSRRVATTAAGDALLPLARTVIGDLERIVQWAAGPAAAGPVTVGVMATSSRFRELVAAARGVGPGLDLRIRQLGFEDPLGLVRRRELDAAVVAELADTPPDVDDIGSHPLWQERLVVAVREDHPLARGTSAHLRDLADETLVCGPGGLRNARWFAIIHHLVGGQAAILPAAHNLEEVIEMCATGLGVAVVGESAIEMFFRPGVAYVPIVDGPRATTWLFVRRAEPSRAVARLVDAARASVSARSR